MKTIRPATEVEIEMLSQEFACNMGVVDLIADGSNAKCFYSATTHTVMRVPMQPVIKERTPSELALLYALRSHITSVAIPEIEQVGVGGLAHSYRCVPGVTVDREWLSAAAYEKKQRLAQSVRTALNELHSISLPQSIIDRLPRTDTFDGVELMSDLVRGSHLDYLLDDIQCAITYCEWFDRYDKTVLLHNDIAAGNLIIDERGELTGIIDWTNAYCGPSYREYRQLAIVAPDICREIAPPQLWPAVVCAAFLRAVRLALCEPDSRKRTAEMMRTLREFRASCRYVIRLEDADDITAFATYESADGLTTDITEARAFTGIREANEAARQAVDRHPSLAPRAERPSYPFVHLDNLVAMLDGTSNQKMQAKFQLLESGGPGAILNF